MFGSTKSDSIDTLTQAMGRAIRVNGAPTRDGLLKADVEQLLRNLEVVTRKSLNVPSPDLEVLREKVMDLNLYLIALRGQEGI